ncbi:MAG: nucleotide-binding protein [Candidatus Eremiobacteraeota bacterium]|nr:nucleotide-binding protein [Candidatus Eremiobacteraeota bacterium]
MSHAADDWITPLSDRNLLGLLDVLLDLDERLQLDPDARSIGILPATVRFRELFPGDGVNMRDEYGALRWTVAKMLETRGVLRNVDTTRALHRWQQRIKFQADRQAVADALAAVKGAMAERSVATDRRAPNSGTTIFIGHGRASDWMELREFITSRLGLPYCEFNSVSTAGVATKERLEEMLDASSFAFLVLTAEDPMPGGSVRARENVIHEAGLFQGRLGFERAIVLLEEGCEEFSNIHGIGQIRFRSGEIKATFEEVRAVLERERIIS